MPRTKSSRILHRLIALGPATRGELGDELDISSATVTRVVSPLIDLGVVRALDEDGSDFKMGKPAYRIGIVQSYTFFIGIKVTDSMSFGVLVDMNGAVLDKSDRVLEDGSPKGVIRVLRDQVRALAGDRRIDGVGVGVGGRVDNGWVSASGILKWKDVPLEGMLEKELGIPVTVSNDVNAFAQAESWWGAGRGRHSFVLISIGAGIGCSTVVDGVVLEGEHHSAGMIGHLPVDDRGPRCEMGHVGCVRAYASSTCILRELSAHGIDETFDEFVAKAAQGAVPEYRMASKAVSAVARMASGAVALVDPDTVVVSGEGVGLLMAFEGQFRSDIGTYRHWNSPETEVLMKRMEFSTWAQGAAATAMERWTQVELPHR